MARFIEGIPHEQVSLLPPRLDDYVGPDHMARLISAFVDQLEFGRLGFDRALPALTGRPGYHPGTMLKLYIYGYMHGVQSSRRLEAESLRNLEVQWLLNRLIPDFRTIAAFRQDNKPALVAVCAAFVQFCRQQGQLASRQVAIDGTKIRAVASPRGVAKKSALTKELAALKEKITRYLAEMAAADAAESAEPSAKEKAAWVKQALDKLKKREGKVEELLGLIAASGREMLIPGEPEARSMVCNGQSTGPAYNVQTAVSTDTHLIVHFEVTQDLNDRHQLVPMAEAVQQVLQLPAAPGAEPQAEGAARSEPLQVLADAGYSNGEQAAYCEEAGIVACAPPQRAVNTNGLFDRSKFTYDPETNTYLCPAGQQLHFKQHHGADKLDSYAPKDCSACPLKAQCTTAERRTVSRSWYEDHLNRMARRIKDDPTLMRRRRATVEHPFGTLKAKFAGRFLTRGLTGARAEMALQVLAYNFRRLIGLRGVRTLLETLA